MKTSQGNLRDYSTLNNSNTRQLVIEALMLNRPMITAKATHTQGNSPGERNQDTGHIKRTHGNLKKLKIWKASWSTLLSNIHVNFPLENTVGPGEL